MSNSVITSAFNAPIYKPHPRDPEVGITTNRESFIVAAQNPDLRAVIFQRSDKSDIDRVLNEIGYKGLADLYAFSVPIQITKDSVTIARDLPPALKDLISDRARLLSEALGLSTMRLTMGNLRVEKYHGHFEKVMTGTIINKGTQWPICLQDPGQVEHGDDFLMGHNFDHRSYPVKNDEQRFVWTLSNPIERYI